MFRVYSEYIQSMSRVCSKNIQITLEEMAKLEKYAKKFREEKAELEKDIDKLRKEKAELTTKVELQLALRS